MISYSGRRGEWFHLKIKLPFNISSRPDTELFLGDRRTGGSYITSSPILKGTTVSSLADSFHPRSAFLYALSLAEYFPSVSISVSSKENSVFSIFSILVICFLSLSLVISIE